MRNKSSLAVIVLVVLAVAQAAGAEVDREKLLKEPGVYGTFAVFKVGDHWWQLDHDIRAGAAAEVKKVIQKHADKVTVDTHLLRGLSERADLFVRVHSKDMLNNQNFLVDLMGTTLGKDLKNTETFNGITKALNYVPSFPEELRGGAEDTSASGHSIRRGSPDP